MYSEDERFHSIHKQTHPLMCWYANRHGIPFDELDDVIQDVFLSYYEHYPLTWPDGDVKAMLMTMLKNRCIDYARKRENRPVPSEDLIRILEEEDERIGSEDCLTLVIRKENCQELREALQSMRQTYLIVFYMFFTQLRAISEISQALGISEDACRMRLSRSRQHLKTCLKKKSWRNRTTRSRTLRTKAPPEPPGDEEAADGA